MTTHDVRSLTESDFLELVGDPRQFYREMESFRESAAVLSSGEARLIEQYPDQWVAVHAGEVRANADSLEAVLQRLDSLGVPRSGTIVRLIETNPPTMILATCQ